MPENCAAIIDLLIERRHKLGMTQNDLAKAACVKQPVIARLESKKAIPQLNTLLKVATALGCSLEVVPMEAEPNRTTYAAMEAAESREDVYGPFDSVDDLMEALNI